MTLLGSLLLPLNDSELTKPLIYSSSDSTYPSGMSTPSSDWDFTGSGATVTDRLGVMNLTINETGSPDWVRDANGLYLNAGVAGEASYNADNYWEAVSTTYNDMTSFTFYMDITTGPTLKDIRDFFCIGSGSSNNGNNNSFKWTNGHSNQPDLYISQELNESIMGTIFPPNFGPAPYLAHYDGPSGDEHYYVAKTIMNGRNSDERTSYSLSADTRYIMKISHVVGTRYRSDGYPARRGTTQIKAVPYSESTFSAGAVANKIRSTSMYNTDSAWKLRSKTASDRQLDYRIKTLVLYANKGIIHTPTHDDAVLTYLKGL